MKKTREVKQNQGKSFVTLLKNSNTIIAIIAVAIFGIMAIFVPYFLTFRNISNILISASSTGIMAIGLTYVMISGGIDLSCPGILAMSATIGCKIMVDTGNVFLGVLVIILVGIGVGLLNGIAIGPGKMVPMIATLAVATMCEGFTNWYTQAATITGMPGIFTQIFAGKVLKISYIVFYYIALIIIFHLVLTKTIFGKSIYAIGTNSKAASIVGINPTKIKVLIYTLAGFLYGFGGVLASARVGGASSNLGPQDNFTDVVTVVVLGGTSVAGGKGTIIGTFVASIIVAIISNVMNLTKVNYYYTLIIKGLIVIIISYIDILRYIKKEEK